jgi:hypothetical protein
MLALIRVRGPASCVKGRTSARYGKYRIPSQASGAAFWHLVEGRVQYFLNTVKVLRSLFTVTRFAMLLYAMSGATALHYHDWRQ